MSGSFLRVKFALMIKRLRVNLQHYKIVWAFRLMLMTPKKRVKYCEPLAMRHWKCESGRKVATFVTFGCMLISADLICFILPDCHWEWLPLSRQSCLLDKYHSLEIFASIIFSHAQECDPQEHNHCCICWNTTCEIKNHYSWYLCVGWLSSGWTS